MNSGQKRSFERSELLENDDHSRYERGSQIDIGDTGDRPVTNRFNTSSLNQSTDTCPAMSANEASSESDADKGSETRNERRLEMNRQRAKDIRKRKKQMIEAMQKQIILLTIENDNLQAQNKMQRAELNLLHNTLKPILSNQQTPLHNAPRSLANSSVQGRLSSIGNNASALSDFLQAPDVGNNLSNLINSNSSIAPSNTGYTIPAHRMPSFAPNLANSTRSGIIGDDIHLPSINSNVRTNPALTLPNIGSSSLQMADIMSGDNLRLQNNSMNVQSMADLDSRRNQLLLSLLHERQLSNSNYRQDLGGGKS